jgi:hypothetical protein
MVLFLDFDGCLHNSKVVMKPCSQADAINLSAEERRFVTKNNYLVTGENLFEHCDRLAVALEPFPEVRIVISSTWRQHFSIDALKDFLPPALAERVIGVTPIFFSRDGTYQRMREIGSFLEENGYPQWIAIDDNEYPFKAHRDGCFLRNLILLERNTGFTESAAALLQQRLMEIRISHPVTNEKE